MSRRLFIKYYKVLRKLHKVSAKKRTDWLKKNCSKEFLDCICISCKNILKGNVPLTAKEKKLLARKKKLLRKLANEKTSLKTKKAIVQKGGFLGALLGPVLSILTGVLSG